MTAAATKNRPRVVDEEEEDLTDAVESRHASTSESERAARILAACERKDIDELRDMAIAPGGFLSDTLRSRAWPILLGFDAGDGSTNSTGTSSTSWRRLPPHRDEEQVKLDVDRSFVYYPNDNSQTQLQEKKSELSDLITQVLREQPYLCYFQGYHDICQVLLLVLPAPLRALAVARLSVLRIRDFMLPTLAPAVSQLRLIPDILSAADPALCAHLSRNEPYFALADTLTMFAHNVRRYGDIARLFDALLAREQVLGVYVFARIVVRRRDELLAHDEPDMLHFALSKLPADLDLDAVVSEAARLLETHPPESLRSWRRISAASALKTTRDARALARQSLRDGRVLFDRQVAEMRRAERSQKVMQAAWANRTLLFTILIGVSAIYLRRTTTWTSLAAWVAGFARLGWD
ncbi:rab-GTPase-TBC domain-containing protein [Nemania sp. NC0429]|nr:rab-GTPase-TBC domain-containing protein [Nemania sp. NC0429]